jgi:hypothetical protein
MWCGGLALITENIISGKMSPETGSRGSRLMVMEGEERRFEMEEYQAKSTTGGRGSVGRIDRT